MIWTWICASVNEMDLEEDLVCLFDRDDYDDWAARSVESALRNLSASIQRRDDYFDEDDQEEDFLQEGLCKNLDGKWVGSGHIHQIIGTLIYWHNGEITQFQRHSGLAGDTIRVYYQGQVKIAKVQGPSLVWPTETWVRKSFCAHIATRWPNPPPKVMESTSKRVSELRFASDTISDRFQDGRHLMEMVNDLCRGGIHLNLDPNMILDCVALPLGQELYCLNNRRLWCLKQWAEKQADKDVMIRVKIYNFSDSAAFFQSRITTANAGLRVSIRKGNAAGDLPQTDMPESMYVSRSKLKAEYLHLTCDGFQVDVLISCTRTLSGKNLVDALLREPFGKRHRWAAVCASAHSKELQCESSQQQVAIKLAKLWVWYVAFPHWSKKLRPRSFLIELMVRHVHHSQGPSKSAWEVFVAFLKLCAKKSIEPILWDWQQYKKHPAVNWGKGPRIIDPLNPTNNVARPFRCWSFLRKYARKSLEKIQMDPRADGPKWWDWSEDEEAPRLSPANPEEVRKALLSMGLPQHAVQGLLDFGFTSLEVLCQLGKESDFLEVGMNKAQARLLCKNLEDGGYIFKKLQAEREKKSEAKAKEAFSGMDYSKTQPIPLMCYPAHRQPKRCFLTGTLVSVLGKQKVAVEDLRPGKDSVMGASGRPLHVVNVKRHDLEGRWLVRLTARGASLTVTENHRVQILGEEEQVVETEARKLQKGDLVPCTGGHIELEKVENEWKDVQVVELEVRPDDIFEAFHTPAFSFLCKGQVGLSEAPTQTCRSGATWVPSAEVGVEPRGVIPRRNRRGGQNRRDAAAAAKRWVGDEGDVDEDVYSYVETAWSGW